MTFPTRPFSTATMATLAASLMMASLDASAADAPAPRVINVSGEADISVVPDRARLQLGITQLSLEVGNAEAAVNKVVKAYVAEARKLGSSDEEIGTAGISIQPEYVWDEKTRNNRLTGYRVSRDIEVRITRLDKLGDYLIAATRAGVNQVQPPQLESSKSAELQDKALVQAAKNAQAKARLLAETVGAKLGSIRTLSENGSSPPQPMMKVMAMRAEAADSGNAEMGLQTGEIRYHASVNAEFDVVP